MQYFISDTHLGGNLYVPPFKSREHFVKRIIDGINQRVKPNDILYVIGDLNSYGNVGYKSSDGTRIVTESLRLKGEDYLAQIRAKVILVAGNHDFRNHSKPNIVSGFADVGRYTAFLSHYPTDSDKNDLFYYREQRKWRELVRAASFVADFAIVGHVHTAPKIRYDFKNGLANINVSAEARNWLPISAEEIVREYDVFRNKKVDSQPIF